MTDTTAQTAGNADGAGPAPPQTLARRVRRSFTDSSGSIVFGMEDGTVSIFALVFGVAAAVDLGAGQATRQNPYVQSAWMFITDLFAAAVPVIPFAIFGLGTARIVSLIVTFALLVVLGVGRARIGRRKVLPTVAQTVGIATAAAVAGLLVGKLIS